ncbi:MAG: nicotinate-nucleotide pyrophosphorylase (carboxylating) [Planctomycetota bacterium]|jgi:nicotinate-nucleotide pyrophosphorylase (carboxylating)
MDDSELINDALDDLIRRALAEDLGLVIDDETLPGDLVRCDLTTRTAVPKDRLGRATLVAKESGVFAGGQAFYRALRYLDPTATVQALVADGQTVVPGDIVLHAHGNGRALLVAERTALNIVQRMSGIASRTRQCVDLVQGTGARILDTRKTTPGMRTLDKYAVRVGGGSNHRLGLFDEVMVKENHVDLAGRSIEEVLRDIRSDVGPDVKITSEARDEAEAVAAIRGGADVVLLDNMSPMTMADMVPRLRALATELKQSVELEASGGITHETLPAVARSGVDRISMGALTHSAPALDMSLQLEFDDADGADRSSAKTPARAEVVRRDDEPGTLDLDLPATHAHGRMARRIARQFAVSEGLPTVEIETLEFVVGELLDNAVDHGGGGAARELHDLPNDVRMRLFVRVKSAGQSVLWSVRVEDQGGGEPAVVRSMIEPESGIPDLEDERGRGFFLLAQMVDELDVTTSVDGLGLALEARKAHERAAS